MVAFSAMRALKEVFAATAARARHAGRCRGKAAILAEKSLVSVRMLGRFSLLAAISACAYASAAIAFGPSDPFNTEAMTPPRPLLAPHSGPAESPCKEITPGMVLGVVEVVETALCRNPGTHEAWANARVQAAEVGVAQATLLPTLDASAGIDYFRTNAQNGNQKNASLTLSWLLYDFGARSANVEAARQLLSAASATLDATVQSVFLNALQAYYNAQAARAAVTAAIESERASRESLTAAEVRYGVGTGTPSDKLQAQTAWSQATLNRIRTEGAVKTADGTLANVMGLDANETLNLAPYTPVVPDAAFERDVAALIETARQDRPELKAAEALVKSAQSTVAATRAAGLPTLSLAAGPSWIGTTGGGPTISTHGNSIGLTLNVPIFSGFDTTYRVRSAQARVDATSAQRDNVRLQVALDVWTAYQALLTSLEAIRTTADLLASAEQSERVALGRYKAGVGNILDVLNAQSALAAARLQRIQAMLDWHVSRASLAKAVGTLDSRLLNPSSSSFTTP
jgi:TolC family type I secretion outer membrane protein